MEVSEPFLIAHVVNAIAEHAVVEFEVAYATPNDEWYTNEGQRVWPFWTCEIEHDLPSIPEGWLDHLQQEAVSFAAARPSAKVNILALLPQAPKATIRRRL